jgi:hypothetical protein
MRRSIERSITLGSRFIAGAAVVALFTGSTFVAIADTSTARTRSTESGDTSELPNLDDPIVRTRFVCSFGPGSFGIPPQLSADDPGPIPCGAGGPFVHDDDLGFEP